MTRAPPAEGERGPAEPRLAAAFAVVGAGAALAATTGGLALAWAWPAAVAARVSLAYARGEGAVFGKRADGGFGTARRLAFAPYHGVAWLVWRALAASGEHPHDEIAPGLRLGRLPRPRELPADTTLLVDLTAEFPRPATGAGVEYVALPTLDGAAPAPEAFARLVERVARHPGPVYVHCAAGHGRSAAVVAAVLVARGLAADPDAAAALLRARRPLVRMSRPQRALLAAWARSRARRAAVLQGA